MREIKLKANFGGIISPERTPGLERTLQVIAV